jgi:excinuclease ABC subunit A
MIDSITVKGARQHNLKNIDLVIPKNKFVVFTGVSGSGKSSLAFDTIYAEGQRRYVESLSSYARQFLGIMDKPDVDSIEGLSPSISIDQKSTSHNPRSTVGTVTEIYDYLRLLFARTGHPHCPKCGREISRQTSAQIVRSVIEIAADEAKKAGKKPVKLMLIAPLVRDRKGEFSGLFDNLRSKGFRYIRVDSRIYSIDEDILLIKTNKHSIDAIVDRITLDRETLKLLLESGTNPKSKEITESVRIRITEAIEQSLALSSGLVTAGFVKDAAFDFPEKPKNIDEHVYSERFSCPVCNISIPEIEPRSFSFNSPHGACPLCTGIGSILTVDPSMVIAPSISLSEGGVIPFAKMFYHDTWYSRVVTQVCEINHINTKIPLGELTQKERDLLLYGTGDTVYTIHGKNRFGEDTVINEKYSGIIEELKKRYSQTESEFMRSEIEKFMRQEICTLCGGKRLKKESLTVTIDNMSIADLTSFNISDAIAWFVQLISPDNSLLNTQERAVSNPIVKEIKTRLTFLKDVGLDYLTLDRGATSLSGGESQRIRLASQIGSGLSGVLYVLDEPSIGLHPRDNLRLINTLKHLRDLGNTVVVVEHDREMMEASDYLVDFGPGAGKNGGTVVSFGSVSEVMADKKSVTGKYLTDERKITRPTLVNVPPSGSKLTIKAARENNLKNVTVSFPLGLFTCVTGASGSGKSTLIVETLYRALYSHFNGSNKDKPGDYGSIDGIENIDKVILIDQSPIGRTPRSNPATYTGIFTYVRDLFANLPAARMRGFNPGHFSFNVKGGRCEACEGEGQKRIEMQFLSDVYVTCEVCNGTRYSPETLEITYQGKTISDVLKMTIDEAAGFFNHHPGISDKLKTINEIGLGYMQLGQPATTLSGGEAQRVKLATELMRRSTGRTVYILDEPTTGLHFADLEKLLDVLFRLTSTGNTVIVIEHNLDIIKNSDWIIDLGPEGGDKGGEVIATGTPKNVSSIETSYTGQFLKKILK